MAIVTGDRYLELLASFIDCHAEELLVGSLVLKLNPVGLLYLQSRLASLEELEELRINAPVDYLRAYVTDLGDYRKLEKLRRFLLLLESVQVVSLTKGVRDPTPINLLPFGRLRVLELRGCDLSTSFARGFIELRPHLEKIICVNSANALQHIFLERVVDAPVTPWVCLSSVCCSNNGLLLMDDALRMLPAVRSLDLSRNALTKVTNLDQCTNLQSLDIGFNHISAIDSLGIGFTSLSTLVLRGNALLTTRGLEELKYLEKLDLGQNLLSSLVEIGRLHNLPSLHHLWLDGNPIAELRKYRLQVLSFFLEPFKLVLDSKQASGLEKFALEGFLRLHPRERLILDWNSVRFKSAFPQGQDQISEAPHSHLEIKTNEQQSPLRLSKLQLSTEDPGTDVNLVPDSLNLDLITPTWSQTGTEVSDGQFLADEEQSPLAETFQDDYGSVQAIVTVKQDCFSSTSSSSMDSDSDSCLSNICSPDLGSNSNIGRLMSDFKSRFANFGDDSPNLATEGDSSLDMLSQEQASRGQEEDNHGASSNMFAGMGKGLHAEKNGSYVTELGLGEARWRTLNSWNEGRSLYDRFVTFEEGGPLLDGYRDDAMATAGGGSMGIRRPLRHVKWAGRPTTADGKDDTIEVSRQFLRTLQPGQLTDSRWARDPWGDTMNRIESGVPGRLSGTRSGGLDSASMSSANMKGKGHKDRHTEDELETCFRRTVGDQKTGEHSIGYLQCCCIRVWKGETDESPTILLFSSDSKVYILREEMSQSTLTHRQGLVLRVLASHKLTDVKRLIVGLGLQVLRMHAGAASEYVIATRSASITTDFLQRLTVGTDAEASDGGTRVVVESWGTEQLLCMEKALFDGRKVNVRLYTMLHYRCDIDTGGQWMPVTFVITARSLLLCSEMLHLFAASLVISDGEQEKKVQQEHAQRHEQQYFVSQARRAIRELQKIVPSRKDRCQLSLIFFSSRHQPVVGTSSRREGHLVDEEEEGEGDPRFTVWELQFPFPTVLEQVLPLLKAAWTEAKEQGKRDVEP